MLFHLKELDFDSWQTFGQYRQEETFLADL